MCDEKIKHSWIRENKGTIACTGALATSSVEHSFPFDAHECNFNTSPEPPTSLWLETNTHLPVTSRHGVKCPTYLRWLSKQPMMKNDSGLLCLHSEIFLTSRSFQIKGPNPTFRRSMSQYFTSNSKFTVATNGAGNDTGILYYIGHDSTRVANPLAVSKLTKPEFVGLWSE